MSITHAGVRRRLETSSRDVRTASAPPPAGSRCARARSFPRALALPEPAIGALARSRDEVHQSGRRRTSWDGAAAQPRPRGAAGGQCRCHGQLRRPHRQRVECAAAPRHQRRNYGYARRQRARRRGRHLLLVRRRLWGETMYMYPPHLATRMLPQLPHPPDPPRRARAAALHAFRAASSGAATRAARVVFMAAGSTTTTA